MPFVLSVIIFLFGLAVGSFLNVAICRLETDEKIIKGRSRCPKCGRLLRWYDLVPVLSFLWLCGECRYCGEKISWQYPFVELATGILFLIIFNFQFSILNEFSISQFSMESIITFCYLLIVVCCLVVIFVYDLRYYIIPDKIVFPAIGVSLAYRIFNVFVEFGFNNPTQPPLNLRGGVEVLYSYLFSAFAAAAFFLALVLITRGRGMGLGDVKLAFLMGLILGWPGILLALFLAFFSGALVGVGLIAAGRKQLKSQIPFGPFLAGATIFALFFSESLANWYFTFLGG